ALLDSAAMEKAVLLGYSMGVQVIFEFYRLYPERVRGLIALLGTYGRPFDTLFYTHRTRYLFPLLYWFATRAPGVAQRLARVLLQNPLTYPLTLLAGFRARKEDMLPYYDSLAAIDWALLLRTAKFMAEHTAEDVLADVRVPTLVIGGDADFMAPLTIAEHIAATVPGAELHVLRGATHTGNFECPQEINRRIHRFLKKNFPDYRSSL
ncbi:MAG: alpha/beta fold hydrolase, partial [Vicinamibacteria bacterium]